MCLVTTYKISISKPHIIGNEFKYNKDAVSQKHLSENGKYTNLYHSFFNDELPIILNFAGSNGHLPYSVVYDPKTRTGLVNHLENNGIYAAFRYIPLHKYDYIRKSATDKENLLNSERFANKLLHLPIFVHLISAEQNQVIKEVSSFF